MLLRLLGILLSATILFSFYNDSDDRWNAERVQIRQYLQDEGINDYMEDFTSGYFYHIIESGDSTRDQPSIRRTVEMHYKITLLDGTLVENTFQQATAERIQLSNAIAGLKLVLPNFFIGTKAKIFLPSRLGYGETGLAPSIPANSILIIEVEILEIHPHF